MKKGLMMNSKQGISFSFTQTMVTTLTIALLSACSGNNIVKIDSPVEQLQNLRDNDSDGVIEAREKCEDTVFGAAIDNYGCGKITSRIQPVKINVKFENGSFVIPAPAYDKIKKLAGFLEKNQEVNVVIEGHTSKVGSKTFNQKLSEQRAKAVVLMLKHDFNIAEERLTHIGYGFQRLEDEGQTPKAHATNRRIIAELTHTEHLDEMEWTIYSVDQAL